MNKEKIQVLIAWILLMSLIALFFYVNHLKFFTIKINENSIKEIPIENSSSEAIEKALTDIVDNFNNNPLILENQKNGIDINATLNNYSIYVTYKNNTTTTYEFNYSNLILKININNNPENITKFNTIYEILIKATQERLNNQNDITNLISNHLTKEQNYEGLNKKVNDKTISYTMNITQKLR